MLKNLALQLFGCSLAIVLLPQATLRAQDPLTNEFYGNGVHSFYERDYTAAMNELSYAIDGGSHDPRTYYYRGLAKLRSGDSAGAHADLQRGAALESADVNDFYPVARSLERVQGPERRALERYRAMARAQARQRQIRRDAMRYEERRRNEAHVLRSVPVGPAPASLTAPAAAAEARVLPVPPRHNHLPTSHRSPSHRSPSRRPRNHPPTLRSAPRPKELRRTIRLATRCPRMPPLAHRLPMTIRLAMRCPRTMPPPARAPRPARTTIRLTDEPRTDARRFDWPRPRKRKETARSHPAWRGR